MKKARRNWIVLGIAAAGAAFAGYLQSDRYNNPVHTVATTEPVTNAPAHIDLRPSENIGILKVKRYSDYTGVPAGFHGRYADFTKGILCDFNSAQADGAQGQISNCKSFATLTESYDVESLGKIRTHMGYVTEKKPPV